MNIKEGENNSLSRERTIKERRGAAELGPERRKGRVKEVLGR